MPLLNVTSHTVGQRARDGSLLGDLLAALPTTKTASAPEVSDETVHKMALSMGFEVHRVAGNVFERKHKGDFWSVKDGKLVRLTGSNSVVADDERMDPAKSDDPEDTLRSILADLEF